MNHSPLTLRDVKAALRSGPYAWPGGYPLYFITSDGSALSFEAVRERFRDVVADMADCRRDAQWKLEAVEPNYEDADLRCDHTGARIPSAYAEPDQ